MNIRLLLLAAATLAGCTVGPDYVRPAAPIAARFRDAAPPPPGWHYAAPDDGHGGGAWWRIFADPDLDRLEDALDTGNQTIRQAEAAYRQAQAIIAESRAALFPTLGATGSFTRQKQGPLISNSATLEPTATWDLDVWGRIRRQVESSRAAAEVSAADLANARLTEQASLATLYFDLCYQDELTRLFASTVSAYQRALDVTQNQAQFGVAAPSDVITARTQLEGAQSSEVQAGIARAQDEHAIAALIGVTPDRLSLSVRRLATTIPTVPGILPSDLLQRRPDIAAAERGMAEQNALIGVSVAAFYPDISLSAAFGFAADPVQNLFNAASQVWSLGITVTEQIFEGGLRKAQVDAAIASYDQSVASYRQTVLSAFQQVEDQLSGLRILADQSSIQDKADADAARAVEIALNEYRLGTADYTAVVTEQTILLGDQETSLGIRLSRLNDTVTLIESLGGGWRSGDLPGR